MSDRFRWLRSLPVELRMLLALLLILTGSWVVSQVPAGNLKEQLWRTLPKVAAIGGGLALVLGVGWLLHVRRQRRFRRELELTTAGPTRREEAEREREYKRKWLRGIEQLRASGKSLYDLPWYVIIGEPAGGKTMTLVNSGMDFPLGKEELPGFGGTRNYNWWFTNDAVILDTAGRLVFEQEGTTDKKEWEEFLRTLRNRRRCPINGVIVGLPADKLMKDSHEQRTQAATILRDRLRQMQAVLGVRFPVYLLITKMDLVAGFTEFFDACDALQRNQIFGWSRPGAFETGYDPQDFPRHFGDMRRRLEELRVRFLVSGGVATGGGVSVAARRDGAEVQARRDQPNRSVDEQAWVFTFPEAFQALQDRLQAYVDIVFSRNVFAEPLFFRGFYFTSALQEGKPILELLGSRLAREDLRDLKDLFPQSRAYFIYDFYTRKVAAEQGLVFRSAKQIRRSRLLRRIAYQVMLPALALMLLAFGFGFVLLGERVHKPNKDARRAADLIAQVREQRSGNPDVGIALTDAKRREASNLLDELAADEHVLEGGWLATMLLFDDPSRMVNDLASIRRELFGSTLLVSKVRLIEAALSDESLPLTNENSFKEFCDALLAYLKCSSRQIALEPSFKDMWAILEPSERGDEVFLRHLRAFEHNGDARPAFRAWSMALAAPGSRAPNAPAPVIGKALQRVRGFAQMHIDELLARGDDPWSEVAVRAGEALNRYREILAAGKKFADASSESAAAEAIAAWDRACRAPQASELAAECGKSLFAPVSEALRKLPTTDPGAPRRANPEFEAFAHQIEHFWQDVQAIINAAPNMPGRAELDAFVQRQTADFAQLLQDKTGQTPNPFGNYAFLFNAGSAPLALSDDARQVMSVLDTLSALIHPRQTAAAENTDRLALWTDSIGSLAGGNPGTAASCEFGALAANWSPDDLAAACKAVSSRRQQQARLETLKAIQDALAPSASGDVPPLSRFVKGADAPDPQVPATRLDSGLPVGSTRAFLLHVAEQKSALVETLEHLHERDPQVDVEPVKEALERSMAAYVQKYVDDWAHVYNRYTLPALQDLWNVARNPNWRWRNFRQIIVGNNPLNPQLLETFWQSYASQQPLLSEQLVSLLEGKPETANTTELATLMRAVKPSEADKPFARWYQARLDARALPDLKAGHDAWNGGAQIITTLLEQFDERDCAALSRPIPRVDAALDAEAQGDYLGAQLQWVFDLAEALLNAEVNEKVQRLRKPLPNGPTFFPFAEGKPREPLGRVREVLNGLAAMRFCATNLGGPKVRERFFEQAAEWSRVLARDSYQIRIRCEIADAGARKELPREARVEFHCPSLQDEQDRLNMAHSDEKFIDPTAPKEVTYAWQPEGKFFIKFGDLTLANEQKDSAFFWFLLSDQCEAVRDSGSVRYRTKPRVAHVGRSAVTLTMEFQLLGADKTVLALPEPITMGSFGDVQRPPPPWEVEGKAGASAVGSGHERK